MFPIKHSRRTTGTCVTMLPRTQFFFICEKKTILIIRRPSTSAINHGVSGGKIIEKISLHPDACESITIALNTSVSFLYFTSIFPSFPLQNTTFHRVNGIPLRANPWLDHNDFSTGFWSHRNESLSVSRNRSGRPRRISGLWPSLFVIDVIPEKSPGEIARTSGKKKNIKLLKINIITTRRDVCQVGK